MSYPLASPPVPQATTAAPPDFESTTAVMPHKVEVQDTVAVKDTSKAPCNGGTGPDCIYTPWGRRSLKLPASFGPVAGGNRMDIKVEGVAEEAEGRPPASFGPFTGGNRMVVEMNGDDLPEVRTGG